MAPTGIFAPLSREGGLVLNNLLLCSMAAVVLVGTLWPMFADLLFQQKISVGPPFFNTAILPLAVPLVLAMAAGPLLPWKRAALWPVLQRLWWAALLSACALALCFAFMGVRVGPAVGFAAATWLIAGAAADILDRIALFRRPSAAFSRARGLPRAAWGAAIAHAGLGVSIAGMAGMGLATDKLVALPPGGSTSLGGYEWRLDSVADATGPNWTSRRATVTVTRHGATVAIMHPERRFFPLARMNTTEAAIHTTWLSDLYLVLGEEEGGRAVLRIHHNPMAPWIWLGAAIMALGGGLSLSDRRIRVSAPGAKRASNTAGAPA
jgi:cytochrome c-type biogenesis protein CcmF